MKRILAVILTVAMIFVITSCSKSDNSSQADVKEANKDLIAHIDSVLKNNSLSGVIYLTQNGQPVYEYANGSDKEGNKLKPDTTIFIGSVSKQFCAAAVMILRDEGKLSVDDTIDKYFPEYKLGKKITVKNLLTMRSGIYDMVNDAVSLDVSPDYTEEENTAIVKKWIFEQELRFEPDTSYAYSNSNYFLLANIVEQISEQSYNDFVRERIFEPLEMTHTGFLSEYNDNPSWAENAVHDNDVNETKIKGLAKGAGNIMSNGPDMTKWMDGLMNGKIVSKETLDEMTENYSPDTGEEYGYGLESLLNGNGHQGAISSYVSTDYFNRKKGYCLFSSGYSEDLLYMPSILLKDFV